MRLIPPEEASLSEAAQAPMTLVWSPGGHPGEYLLRLPCITDIRRKERDIPESIASALADDLGEEWYVSNRGTRIEISHVPLGPENHELIMSVANRLLEQVVQPQYVDGG